MTPRLLLILTLLVGGCASARGDIPPGCDGRDRRPANPYGSILVPSTPAPPERPAYSMSSRRGLRMTGVPSEDLKRYFTEARRWDQDRLASALRSRRLAWTAAGAATASRSAPPRLSPS